MRLWRTTIVCFCLCCTHWLAGQNTLENEALPVDTSVQLLVLENGLTVYLQEHDEPRQRVSLRLLVKAGSLQEEDDQLGLAHFVEHMAFNGTDNFAKNTIIDFIEQSGSRFGADLNASTSFSETIYKLQVRSDSLSLVDTALQIMADWAGGLTFDPEEVDKERGIIRSEWRSGLSSNQRLQLQAYGALLAGSRYAERLPIGSPELIDTVKTQRLVDYYRRWYRPQNMALVVVGQVDMSWVENRVRELFTPLQNQDFTPPESYSLDGTARRVYLLASDPEAPFTRWELVWQHGLNRNGDTYKTVRQRYIKTISERILNKRLAARKEQELLPFTFAYSGFSGLPGNYDAYRMNAMCKPAEVFPALAVLVEETQRATRYGFSELEITQEMTAIRERAEQTEREWDKYPSSSRAGRIGTAYLRGTNVTDLNQAADTAEKTLASISADDLQAAIAQGLQSPVLTAIITTNTEQQHQMPDSLQFFQALDSLLALPVSPPAEKGLSGPLLQLPETEEQYTLIETDTIIGVQTYALSNGVKVYFKPTDFSNDQIQFRAFSTGGTSLCTDEEYFNLKHGLSVLNESGLDTFRESQLLQILSDKQVRISPYVSTYEEGLGGSSNQEDLETFFQLGYLYFTRPRFDSIVLNTYLDRQHRIFERIDTDPRAAFGRMMVDKKYDYHPRRPNTTLEELEYIDLQRAEQLYRKRFANIGDFQLVFVGNFEPDTLLRLADRYFGSLPTTTERESWNDNGLRLSPSPIDTVVRAGQTPKAEVNLTWHGPFPYADRNERLHHSALRQLLSIRLREVLREDLGGVYGVRVSGRFRNIPDSIQQIGVRFNAEPDVYEQLILQIEEEVAQIAAGNIPDEIIPKITATRLKSYQEATRSNGFWLGQIQQCLQRDLGWEVLYPGYYEERLKHINEADLARAAKRYIQGATSLKFVLLPETP